MSRYLALVTALLINNPLVLASSPSQLFAAVGIAGKKNPHAAKDSVLSQFNQAQMASQKGDIEKAIQLYMSLIEQQPELLEAYNNLAVLYSRQGKIEQARNALEKGLHAKKNYSVLYDNLSALNLAQARASYGKAFQVELKQTQVALKEISLDVVADNSQLIASIKQPDSEMPVSETVVQPVVKTQPAQLANNAVVKPARVNPVVEIKSQPGAELTTSGKVNLEAVETVIQAWAVAWSAKAVDMYLSFYHPGFRPGEGLSYTLWKSIRKERITKPKWISVTVSDFKFIEASKRKVVVSFRQKYRSNSFNDVSTKQLTLFYTTSGWRIYKEKAI